MLPLQTRAGEPDTNHSPYQINLPLDLGITVGTLAVGGMPRLFLEEYLQPECGLACDPDQVNSLDRQVIGNHSQTANLLSDIGDGAGWSLPFVIGALDVMISDPVDGWSGYGKDALVYLQTLSVTLCVNNLLSFMIRRPRPLVYDVNRSDEDRLLGDSAMSFPSGHTSSAFAMATAYSYTFTLRHPDSPWVIPVWAGTHALAAATGILRVEAGDHFWTDVAAGAILGIGLGALIPYLHQCGGGGEPPRITLAPWITRDGGFGAALSFH